MVIGRWPPALHRETVSSFPMTKMHNPPHPGETLRVLCLSPLGLTVTDAAKALGVSRRTLSEILSGHAGISAEMAIRLSIAFDTTAESCRSGSAASQPGRRRCFESRH